MFKAVIEVLSEQVKHWNLIYRMSRFEVKGNYQNHYLGTLWQFLNPIIQIMIYWIVFGIGIRGGSPIEGVPYIIWLLMGLIPWFFISPSMIQGSNSIHQKVSLVSKMNFPVSLLPTIKIVSNSVQFIILMTILMFLLIINGVPVTLQWIQLIYYFICIIAFIFSFSLFSSTISTLVRDYQTFLSSTMRMLLYLSPILWDPEKSNAPEVLTNILKLNPVYYLISGIRDTFLGKGWFFEEPIYMLYFWVFTLILLYFGSKLHVRFRENFMDYL
ncbi:teichoic acid translocation permease protein TagG [Paraliobacillus quinghaiensis]|uniref:Transport permease protein n=1 Tax=Paraliobacillus quinghaiensis TaxID=470815 RepID=A0A917TQ87_9BACI|nr:ABC transporter permease [Paraliobacillus quinghaiensis]GGM32341.1 teichoic acid translocation permease protein TagG [Paraliobacillus quinghaiensis]